MRSTAVALALLFLALAPAAPPAQAASCDTPVVLHFVGGASCDAPVPSTTLGAMSASVLVGENADGTFWRVTYFVQNYATPEEAERHAQMHLTGALASYANLTSWGLVSRDPDRVLDLTLDGCDCIRAGFEADIRMFPRANDILPLVPGLAYRSEAELAHLIVGHELFHHFQYSHQQWRMGMWLVEGMARFSETVNVPDMTFLPTSLVYYPDDNGMNGFLLDPSRTISQHSYDWSLAWGYLYAHDGGIALLRAVLDETANATGDPNVAGPAAIQRAMDRTPGGEHATFESAYADFARALLTKRGFVWGAPDGTQTHDWATHLDNIGRIRSTAGRDSLLMWGIQVHDAKPLSLEGTALIGYSTSVLYEAAVMTRAGGETTFTSALPANPVVGASDAALVVVRLVPVSGDLINAAGTYAFAVAR